MSKVILKRRGRFKKRDCPDYLKICFWWEFPDGPVIRTLDFYCYGLGLIPGQGTKISQAVQQGQKKREINNKIVLEKL